MATASLPATTRVRTGYYFFLLAGYRVEVVQVPTNEEETKWAWNWAVCDAESVQLHGKFTLYPELMSSTEQGFFQFQTKREALEHAVSFVPTVTEKLARLQADSRHSHAQSNQPSEVMVWNGWNQ